MRVAITGGIGSGKSYVCRLLAQRGITVYDCDAAAKRLMATSPEIREGLIREVGEAVYDGDRLQKAVLAEYLLRSEAHKQRINGIVHPAVAQDFIHSGREWLESAILFESGFHRRVDFDAVVCVTAPREVRVQRVMRRDGITRERATQWVDRQMPQEEMLSRSQYEIHNDGLHDLQEQVGRLLAEISESNTKHLTPNT